MLVSLTCRHRLHVVADVLSGFSLHGVEPEAISVEDVDGLRPVDPVLVRRSVEPAVGDDSPRLPRAGVVDGRPDGCAAVAIDRTPTVHEVHTLNTACVVLAHEELQVLVGDLDPAGRAVAKGGRPRPRMTDPVPKVGVLDAGQWNPPADVALIGVVVGSGKEFRIPTHVAGRDRTDVVAEPPVQPAPRRTGGRVDSLSHAETVSSGDHDRVPVTLAYRRKPTRAVPGTIRHDITTDERRAVVPLDGVPDGTFRVSSRPRGKGPSHCESRGGRGGRGRGGDHQGLGCTCWLHGDIVAIH